MERVFSCLFFCSHFMKLLGAVRDAFEVILLKKFRNALDIDSRDFVCYG